VRRDVVEVARGVYVATSRRYATTSTVVVSGDAALLVDPAWDADELGDLADNLSDLGVTGTAGLSTHVHYDQSPRTAPQVAEPTLATVSGR